MSGPTETLSPALPADIEQLAVELLSEFAKSDLRIATAESCTGGLLASLLTDVEGCGHCFERGFVTYTDDSKAELLGVPREVLAQEGAVSSCTAEAMLRGALKHSQADIAAAITGFAGQGAEGEEPGLVYIGVGRRDGPTNIREYHFGDIGRGEVRLRCLREALGLLRQTVQLP